MRELLGTERRDIQVVKVRSHTNEKELEEASPEQRALFAFNDLADKSAKRFSPAAQVPPHVAESLKELEAEARAIRKRLTSILAAMPACSGSGEKEAARGTARPKLNLPAALAESVNLLGRWLMVVAVASGTVALVVRSLQAEISLQ